MLNPINVEYKRKIIDRLEQLSDELGSEFYRDSSNYWLDNDFFLEEAIMYINKCFMKNKEKILKTKRFNRCLYPYPERFSKMGAFLDRINTDPFIPKKISDMVVDLLENRIDVWNEVFETKLEKYQSFLAKGIYDLSKKKCIRKAVVDVHNSFDEEVEKLGVGIPQIYNEVDTTRLEIQRYLESFNPIK
ncbi:MAG: hypothetical protein PHI90_09730 [Clostridia bacterium]|nr:hypothetical protein [Clostridia bacterium]MDD4049075.1 hypothetical protein [Clostridia bacterium]